MAGTFASYVRRKTESDGLLAAETAHGCCQRRPGPVPDQSLPKTQLRGSAFSPFHHAVM